ncbi:MAG: hypothetical protein FWF53_02950 [Candidatus Azobacteroides sp.]|nr:hypothetical protein [Candidatus Azobacteroides sp.]
MPVKVKINIDWKKVKENIIQEIDTRVTRAFQIACKETVIWAKQNHKYTQQTGALNSSVGFQLYKDGVLTDSYFEQSQGGNDKDGAKAKGVSAGEKTTAQRASELGAHICAVIVAGMPYAIYVESKGYDVLTGAEKQFPSILEKRMKEAFADIPGVSYQVNG